MLYKYIYSVQYLGDIEEESQAGPVHAGDDDIPVEAMHQVQRKH
jgi:hypothetical protein